MDFPKNARFEMNRVPGQIPAQAETQACEQGPAVGPRRRNGRERVHIFDNLQNVNMFYLWHTAWKPWFTAVPIKSGKAKTDDWLHNDALLAADPSYSKA